MAGSMKWFVYETDNGDKFGLWQDESNGEAVENDDYSLTDTAIKYALPKNVQPRQAIYRSADGRISRKIAVCNPAATVDTLPNQIQVLDYLGSPVSLFLTNMQGEQFKRIPIEFDTGLNDGDAG